MKKFTIIILAVMLLLVSCGAKKTASDKLVITAVNFPSYDAARAVAGDSADIRMLLPCGAESHSYEPTPDDIKRIMSSDLFVYTGGESDEWVEYILDDLDKKVHVFSLMDAVDVILEEAETLNPHDHDHEHEADHDHAHEHEHEHEHESDEHVWTSPANEKRIIEKLCAELVEMDGKNREIYEKNAKAYVAQIEEIDSAFRKVVENARTRTIVVADRFPLIYFTTYYGLEAFAAFPGCAAETEANANTVASLIDLVRENDVKAILHMELANTMLSKVISEETGAKVLEFNSAHNVSKSDFDRGITWTEIMKNNVNVLKEALD